MKYGVLLTRYPGGKPMDELAQQSAGGVYDLPRAMRAARECGRKTLVAAGGVAANTILRADLEAACARGREAVSAAAAVLRRQRRDDRRAGLL